MYGAAHRPASRLTLTRLLACCVAVSFVLASLSIAYCAGRQQAFSSAPATGSPALR